MKIRELIAILFFTISCSSFQFENKSEINREGIRQTFLQNKQDIYSCYQDHGEAKKLTGKMVFDFELDDKGKVLYSTINEEKSILKDTALGGCVSAKMKSWQFPKSASTETTQIFYPVYFEDSATTSKK